MLYFAELDEKKVFTDDEVYLGKLDDFIFVSSGDPLVTKLLIITKSGEKLIVTADSLKKVEPNIILKKAYTIDELKENELFIKRNLLDKQIIDLKGDKVVRVNDVVIQNKIHLTEADQYTYKFFVIGVDIGALGIARRLGIEQIATSLCSLIRIKISSSFLSWGEIQPLELTRGKVKLKKEGEKLENLRPEDLADYLEKTNELNIRRFLRLLDKKLAAVVVKNLSISYQRELFQNWKPEKAVEVLQNLDRDSIIDILLILSKRKREDIISFFPPDERKEIVTQMQYAKTPIGRRISTEYLVVSPQLTTIEVEELIKKKTADFTFFSCIYVQNEKKQLIGAFTIHEMLMQRHDTPVYKFMTQNLIEVNLSTPLEIVIRKMLKYKLPAIPVVTKERQLIGIVSFDEVVDILKKRMFN